MFDRNIFLLGCILLHRALAASSPAGEPLAPGLARLGPGRAGLQSRASPLVHNVGMPGMRPNSEQFSDGTIEKFEATHNLSYFVTT